MKKITFIYLFFFNCICIYSQINIRENIKTIPIDNSTVNKYDSIFNFSEEKRNVDYLKYIGQELFLPPLKDKKAMGIKTDISISRNLKFIKEFEYYPDTIFVKKGLEGHLNGYYDKKAKEMRENIHSVKVKTNIYNPYISLLVSNPYVETEIGVNKNAFNKYYKIFNVTDTHNNNFREIENKVSDIRFWLFDNKNDTIFLDGKMSYSSRKSLQPFIIKGFYEHNLKRYKGKKLFVYKEEGLDGNNEIRNPFVEINTGEIIPISVGDIWLCEEISFIGLPYSETLIPHYILTKDKKQIKVELGELIENGFISLEELENLYSIWINERNEYNESLKDEIKKQHKECGKYFKKEICEKLIKGKIEIGMTKKMVVFAFGNPFKSYKLKSSSNLIDVYSYGGTIIYFKNDVVQLIEQYN